MVIAIVSGPEGGRRSQVGDDQPIVFGRHGTVQITDRRVSKRHARLQQDDDGWYLEDLGSTNGTFVNGKRISSRSRINEGDRIQMGSSALVITKLRHVPPLPRLIDPAAENNTQIGLTPFDADVVSLPLGGGQQPAAPAAEAAAPAAVPTQDDPAINGEALALPIDDEASLDLDAVVAPVVEEPPAPTTEAAAPVEPEPAPVNLEEPSAPAVEAEATLPPIDAEEPSAPAVEAEATLPPIDAEEPSAPAVEAEATLPPIDVEEPSAPAVEAEATLPPIDAEEPPAPAVEAEATLPPIDVEEPSAPAVEAEATLPPIDVEEPPAAPVEDEAPAVSIEEPSAPSLAELDAPDLEVEATPADDDAVFADGEPLAALDDGAVADFQEPRLDLEDELEPEAAPVVADEAVSSPADAPPAEAIPTDQAPAADEVADEVADDIDEVADEIADEVLASRSEADVVPVENEAFTPPEPQAPPPDERADEPAHESAPPHGSTVLASIAPSGMSRSTTWGSTIWAPATALSGDFSAAALPALPQNVSVLIGRRRWWPYVLLAVIILVAGVNLALVILFRAESRREVEALRVTLQEHQQRSAEALIEEVREGLREMAKDPPLAWQQVGFSLAAEQDRKAAELRSELTAEQKLQAERLAAREAAAEKRDSEVMAELAKLKSSVAELAQRPAPAPPAPAAQPAAERTAVERTAAERTPPERPAPERPAVAGPVMAAPAREDAAAAERPPDIAFVIDASGKLQHEMRRAMAEVRRTIASTAYRNRVVIFTLHQGRLLEHQASGRDAGAAAAAQDVSTVDRGAADMQAAIKLALAGRPRNLYLLSDTFADIAGTRQALQKFDTGATAVHVTQFFSRDQRDELKSIARDYHGTYTFLAP